MLESEDNGFFYQKETMGTTIMACKYEGGVIVCADSSTTLAYSRDIVRRDIHRRSCCRQN